MEISIYMLGVIIIFFVIGMVVSYKEIGTIGGPFWGILLIILSFVIFISSMHQEHWNEEVNYSDLKNLTEMELEDDCLNYYLQELKKEAFIDKKISNSEFSYIYKKVEEQRSLLAKEKFEKSLGEVDMTPSDSCINPRWSLN
mgnify:FL=1|jgi:hypothetical protein